MKGGLNACWPPPRCREMSCGAWGRGTSADKAGLALLGKSPALGILWDEPKSLPGLAASAGKPKPGAQHPPGDAGQGPGFQPRLGCWICHPAADGLIKKSPTRKNAERRAREQARELAPAVPSTLALGAAQARAAVGSGSPLASALRR